MPDFFVPVDTSAFSEYFYQVREKDLINKYAFYYSDANRALLSRFKTYHDLASYLKKKNILEKFVIYADEHGVKRNYNDLRVSSSVLQIYLEAYIVRNFFDNAGFYPMINSIDNTLHKAIEIFKTKS